MEQLSAALETLERNARIREGTEVHEGAMASVRTVERFERQLGRHGMKVARALDRMRSGNRTLYLLALARTPYALSVLAEMIPGRLRDPLATQ
jgi:hypothetical protein